MIRGDDIDSVVTAEIPDPEADPELYEIVNKHMVHGPCGAHNPSALCMKNGHCTKEYPKQLRSLTSAENDGYPMYRRRAPADGGRTVKIYQRGEEVEVDNSWIVPYNPFLSRTFKSHLNVELCMSIQSIKYVLKYVHKGNDRASYSLANNNDEVACYRNDRYVSSAEAAWRILNLPLHTRFPSVLELDVHLPAQQTVYYAEHGAEHIAYHPPATTLTAYLQLCQTDDFARTLLYVDVPQYYI